MLLSLGAAFAQLSRDKITNMTLTIAKEFDRLVYVRLFVRREKKRWIV